MTSVTVFCPKCQAALRLPDRSMLGRTGRCPKCSHRFALTELDEVPLELVEPTAPSRPAGAQEPMLGTSARWVPDEQPASSGAFEFAALATGTASQDSKSSSSGTPAAVGKSSAAPASSSGSPSEDSILKRTRSRRRRGGPSRMMLMGTISAVVVGGVIAGVLIARSNSGAVATRNPAPELNEAWEQQKLEMADSNTNAAAVSPTTGEPIPLNYLPFTPHLVCHLRPAELWQKEPLFQEFHACLGLLSLWFKGQILEITTFEPQDIEELTFALNFGPRTTEPEVAAVVRLRERHLMSEFGEHFGRKIRTDLEADIYETDKYSYMLLDEQTFAVGPSSMSDSLAAAKNYPALAPPDLDPLLQESDRTRHFTLLFDIKSIDVHRETIFIDELQKAADQFVVWMGKDIETVSWSFHLKPHFFMETLLHQTNDSSVLKVQRFMQGKLSGLPNEMVTLTGYMQPETLGERKIVGRFPAMMKAFESATTVDVGARYVRLTTLLPDKAASNLAAGSIMTWSRSALTDFSKDLAVAAAEPQKGPAMPKTIAERLKLPVLVDFRNTPLQEAVEFIGEEIKTTVVVDGDALKAAGFTQNMSQTYNLGSVPALTAFDTILAKYATEADPLVIAVDEAGKKIILSTKSKAEADGLAIYPTGSTGAKQ